MRTVHQGMKRTDNETRKRDVTDNEAGKQGLLAGLYSETCEDAVEFNPQAALKSPAEYVAIVIITFTVLHLQFWIHSDYSDYYSFGL